MLKILKYLIQIRLQKLFRKVDIATCLTVLAFYGFAVFIFSLFAEKYAYYFLLTSLDIFKYHTNRKDLELLKFKQNYKRILYAEYVIYSAVYTVPLLVKQQWIPFVLYQILLVVYLYIPNYKTIVIKYPFKLFDPFWVICFRKNKLFLSLVPIVFFIYMGASHQNDNLILFAFLLLALVLILPSLQREYMYFIKVSKHKDYFLQQLKVNSYNSLFMLIPTAIALLCFGKYALLVYLPLVMLPVFMSMLIKYALFDKTVEHPILLVFLWVGFSYFLPFIAIPFLVYYSKKNLKILSH